MNAYLYKKLTELNNNLAGAQKLTKLIRDLESQLEDAKHELSGIKIDVDEANELLELTNQVEGTKFYLDMDAYEVCDKADEPETVPEVAAADDDMMPLEDAPIVAEEKVEADKPSTFSGFFRQ